MRSIGAWKGGFLDFSGTLHHRLRAGGLPSARFDKILGSDSWRWAWNGKAENQAPDIFPKTVWPEGQLRYNGHYPHGQDTIISYSVQGREVLEGPKLEKIEEVAVVHHRLTIKPGGNQLELIVLDERPEIKGNSATAGFSACKTITRAWHPYQ